MYVTGLSRKAIMEKAKATSCNKIEAMRVTMASSKPKLRNFWALSWSPQTVLPMPFLMLRWLVALIRKNLKMRVS